MPSSEPSELSREDRLDLVFQALANRTRRAQLVLLARGPATISELAAPFDMTLPAASKHLRVLERAGLVARRVDGRVHRCSLQSEPLAEIADWVAEYEHFWSGTLDGLARYFEGESDD